MWTIIIDTAIGGRDYNGPDYIGPDHIGLDFKRKKALLAHGDVLAMQMNVVYFNATVPKSAVWATAGIA